MTEMFEFEMEQTALMRIILCLKWNRLLPSCVSYSLVFMFEIEQTDFLCIVFNTFL